MHDIFPTFDNAELELVKRFNRRNRNGCLALAIRAAFLLAALALTFLL